MATLRVVLLEHWRITGGLLFCLWLWRYCAGGKKGWTRRATNCLGRNVREWIRPEKPTYKNTARRDPERFFKDTAKNRNLRTRMFERDGWQCRAVDHDTGQRCTYRNEHGYMLEGDHREPWSKGGRTNLANGVTLCSRHNKAKGDRPVRPEDIVELERRRWWRRERPTGETRWAA